jgi:hypothetical protein
VFLACASGKLDNFLIQLCNEERDDYGARVHLLSRPQRTVLSTGQDPSLTSHIPPPLRIDEIPASLCTRSLTVSLHLTSVLLFIGIHSFQ